MTRSGKEMGILEKILAEEVPYHSCIYSLYDDHEKDYSSEEEFMEGYNDARRKYFDKKAPLVEIKRAHGVDIICEDERMPRIFDCCACATYFEFRRDDIERKGWSIKDLKIFHIRKIRLNEKPHSLPSLVKFQSKTDEIEFELDRRVKSENLISDSKTKFSFYLDTQCCDRILSARVDDFEIEYSLFSNALRVKIEIRAYNADGSSALNVNGNVGAYFYDVHTKHKTVLFDKKKERVKSEPIATRDTPLVSSVLILPGGGIYGFTVDMSLNDSAGKFVVKTAALLIRSNIAVDEQYYVVGDPGYIILRAFWACLCVEQGSICTCAGGTALGTFMTQYDSDFSDTGYEEDNTACHEDSSIEDRKKKAKISESPTGICPSAIGIFLAESNDEDEML